MSIRKVATLNNGHEVYRANNDMNGNSRHVVHFFALLTNEERNDYTSGQTLSDKYATALARSRKLGGRKFHNKQFGGGIVFQMQDCEILHYLNNLTAKQSVTA